MPKYEFEFVEEYYLNGEHRYRLKVKGSNLIINVAADSVDEALSKAATILERTEAEKFLRSQKTEQSSGGPKSPPRNQSGSA